jgi:hypothetical protein
MAKLRPVSRTNDVDRLDRELQCIAESKIYLAPYAQLNDPFEFTVELDFDSPRHIIEEHLRGSEQRTGQRMNIDRAIEDSENPDRRQAIQDAIIRSARDWGCTV